jgi:pantetheine-phosphate adenylyltransferase
MKTALYPGSFDPVTIGHVDIIDRALNIFDELYVVVSVNPSKEGFFTAEERLDMLQNVLKDRPNLIITTNDKLTVQKAKELKATHIVRGLRALTDFEYEFQLTHANRVLDADIDTIFFMTEQAHSFLSSSAVKEIATFGGDISQFLPPYVAEKLKAKIKSR